MFNRNVLLSTAGRGAAFAAVTAIAMATFDAPKLQAAEMHASPAMTRSAGTSGATEFSSRGRHYRGGGGAAALGAFAAVAGGIAAAAIANSGPDYYYGPGYGYGGGYYDAPAYSYGPGYGYYDNGYYGNGGYSGYSSTQRYRHQFGGN